MTCHIRRTGCILYSTSGTSPVSFSDCASRCKSSCTGFSFPFYKKSDKIAAQKAICDVGLENFVNRRIGELSGGQRQRVLLARALCKKPKLLISDEPCTGLDKKTTDDFYNILNNFNKKNNTTIIMVSHDLVNLKKYATRVIKLENKVVFDGNVSALLKIKENLI